MSNAVPDTLPAFTVAFQPIADVAQGCEIFAQEALVRGRDGEGADVILSQVPTRSLSTFDAACRRRSIESALSLGLSARLSLNVMPDAIADPTFGLAATLATARELGFPPDRLIFEITERQAIADFDAIRSAMAVCRRQGALISLDDFGAGFNGLNTLLELRPDLVKLDMGLVRKIEANEDRRHLIHAVAQGCRRLDIRLIAEGIETAGSVAAMMACGVSLMQGYFLARPAIETLPVVPAEAISQAARGTDNVARAHDE